MKKNKKKSSSLKERMQKSYDSKDKGGGNKVRVFDYKKVGEVKFFSPNLEGKGKNLISIVPYEIKTKNDPLVKSGDAKIGDQSYVFDYYSHTSPITSASILCMKETFGKSCAICEQQKRLYDQGKKKEASDLKASRRVAYNVFDHNNPEKGLLIFEVSHYLFEKELIDEARGQSDGDDDFVDFTDTEDGKAIAFRAAKVSKSFSEGQAPAKYVEFKSFSFPDRDDALDSSIVEAAVSFDEIVKIPTTEEVEKLFFGDDGDDDEEESEDDDDDEDEVSSRKAGGKGGKTPGKSGSKHRDEDDDDGEDEDEESDEDSDDDDDSDDEEGESEESEDDDDEDEPVKKTSKGKSGGKSEGKIKKEEKHKEGKVGKKGKCPHGYVFGKDTDKEEECDECEVWSECKELKKAKK